MSYVGFSTGCFYQTGLSSLERIELFKKIGADAVELCFMKPENLSGFELTDGVMKTLKSFKYIAIHAPHIEEGYSPNSDVDWVIDKLTGLYNQLSDLPVRGIVMHTNWIKDMEFARKTGLPFILENSNIRGKRGTLPSHIKEIVDSTDFGFVLDLRHVYQCDPSMETTPEMVLNMDKRLKHIHISGRKGNNAIFPVHDSENSGIIMESFALCYQVNGKVPVISEGMIPGDYNEADCLETIEKEIKFIRKYIDGI